MNHKRCQQPQRALRKITDGTAHSSASGPVFMMVSPINTDPRIILKDDSQ